MHKVLQLTKPSSKKGMFFLYQINHKRKSWKGMMSKLTLMHNNKTDKQTIILVAEDDADDRFILESAFMECGYQQLLKFVENGVELVEFLQNGDQSKHNGNGYPSIILLDLNMPKKDGRDALKEIKEHQNWKMIPVVVFTTTRNDHDIRRCYELGANSYIVKPVVYAELVSMVKQIRSYWIQVTALPY